MQLPNTQKIERRINTEDGLVDIHSIFNTIQGEGPFSGRPAVFIRMAGCNLQCPLCDTNYTTGRRLYSTISIVDKVMEKPIQNGGLVVITGGEPFRQPKPLALLIAQLIDVGFAVQIETNGTLPPPDLVQYGCAFRVDLPTDGKPKGIYMVISPKTGRMNSEALNRCCALKYVVSADAYDPDDGLPTHSLGHTANPHLAKPPANWKRPIYISPADEQLSIENEENREAAVKSSVMFGYTLQAQMHKTFNLE